MSRGARLAVAALAVAALAAWFHSTYAFDGVALFDEGLLADGAVRVLHGERLGRDAFVPYGPASYWVLAPVFQAFGATLGVLRATTVVLQALCDGGLFLLAAATTSLPGALLAAGFLVVAHGSLHKSFLVVATLLVLLALRIAVRPGGRSANARELVRVLEAGACIGVAFLFRHDVGAFGALALLVVVALDRGAIVRRLAGAAGGFLAAVGPAALVLLVLGLDAHSWWDHEWQRIAVQERISVAFPWPQSADGWRWGRAALAAALVLAPCVHVLWGGAALLRSLRGGARDGDATRVGGALFGLLLLNQARLIPSANHLFQAMAPLALALGDLLTRRAPAPDGATPDEAAPIAARPRRGAIAGHAALALLLAALVAWCARMRDGPYSGTFAQRIDHGVALDLPTGGVRLEAAEAQAIAAVVRAIDERSDPDDFLMTSPGCPLFGFLARRRLALPYAEPAYYYRATRFQEEAIAALEQRRPKLFVHDPRPAATFTLEREAPLVAQWLAQHYRRLATIDRFTLFERRP